MSRSQPDALVHYRYSLQVRYSRSSYVWMSVVSWIHVQPTGNSNDTLLAAVEQDWHSGSWLDTSACCHDDGLPPKPCISIMSPWSKPEQKHRQRDRGGLRQNVLRSLKWYSGLFSEGFVRCHDEQLSLSSFSQCVTCECDKIPEYHFQNGFASTLSFPYYDIGPSAQPEMHFMYLFCFVFLWC